MPERGQPRPTPASPDPTNRQPLDARRPTGAGPSLAEARAALQAALKDAARAAGCLEAQGLGGRAAGLATACEVGVSACFVFGAGVWEHQQAVRVARDAIDRAQRPQGAR